MSSLLTLFTPKAHAFQELHAPTLGDVCSSTGTTNCWRVPPRADAIAFSVEASAPIGPGKVNYRIANQADKLESAGSLRSGEQRALSMRASDVFSITGANDYVVHLIVKAVQDKDAGGDQPTGGRPIDSNNPLPPRVGDVCARVQATKCWHLPTDYAAPGLAFSVVASGGNVSEKIDYTIQNSIDGFTSSGGVFYTAHESMSLRRGDTFSLADKQDNALATMTVVAVQAPQPEPRWQPVPTIAGKPIPPHQYDVCKRDDVDPVQGKSCWQIPVDGKSIAFSVFAAGGRAGNLMDIDIYNEIDRLSEVHKLEYGGAHEALVMRPGDRLIIRGLNDNSGALYVAAVQL